MPVVEAKSKLDLLPYLRAKAPSALNDGFDPMGGPDIVLAQAWQQGALADPREQ
ncbi:MAG: hypothetical protein WBG76_06490 [Ornithinimicrobium sp.]